MKLKQGLWVAILSASLVVACGDAQKNNDDLKRQKQDLEAQNAALQNQLSAEQAKNEALASAPLELQDLEKQISSLKNDTLEKEAAIEAQKAAIEALKASGDADAADKIEALEGQIQLRETAIAEQKELIARLEIASSEKAEDLATLLRASITPYAGIWILDPKPALSFSNCQYMVRFDAEEGSVYRAAICDDGKVQAEVQSVAGFTADNGAGWSGTLGFNIDARSRKSSCGDQTSILPSGSSYGFDHSVGTASAGHEAALFMSSKMGEAAKSFKSGSSIPDLGKNKSCGTIITRAKQSSQAGNVLLQEAAKVCQLTKELSGAGCFMAADQFEASL